MNRAILSLWSTRYNYAARKQFCKPSFFLEGMSSIPTPFSFTLPIVRFIHSEYRGVCKIGLQEERDNGEKYIERKRTEWSK